MGLENYADACKEFVWELKASLTKEDVEELRSDCISLGWQKWNQWLGKNYQEIVSYIAATPSQRQRKKSWQQDQHRRRLVLGAISLVSGAHLFLENIVEYDLQPGQSYREMAGKATLAYIYTVYSDLPRWPFDGPDPFSS